MAEYTFARVTAEVEIKKCLAIRRKVFVDEQGINEKIEIDGLDYECVHFLGKRITFPLGMVLSAPIATGRILPRGDTAIIQRVAVLEIGRKSGAGRGIMQAMLDYARTKGFAQAELGAQASVIGFYEKLGFVSFDTIYFEAGIEHQHMRLAL